MHFTNLPLAATIILALGFSGMAHAQESPEVSPQNNAPKTQDSKAWHHHEHGGLWELLPDDKRQLLKEAMEKSRKDNKPLWEQARKAREERDAILKAPDFDQAAYLKKSEEIDGIKDKLRDNREKTFASVASRFSPEERRVLLVMEHMKHMHHHHGAWNHHGGPGDGKGEHQPS